MTTQKWLLVADEAIARVMYVPEPAGDLEEVETMTWPSAHAKEAQLRRDAYGRRSGSDQRSGGNATESAAVEAERLEAGRFADRVAERLAECERQGLFSELTVAAAPRFLGELRKAFSPQVRQRIVHEEAKDLVHESMGDLTRRLFKSNLLNA
jgi:protein required for attachment to host cells